LEIDYDSEGVCAVQAVYISVVNGKMKMSLLQIRNATLITDEYKLNFAVGKKSS